MLNKEEKKEMELAREKAEDCSEPINPQNQNREFSDDEMEGVTGGGCTCLLSGYTVGSGRTGSIA